MSPEKHKAGGPAVEPPRMDQAFQLQNLHRLAMNPEFASMGQYADAYTSPAGRDQNDVSFPSRSERKPAMSSSLTRSPLQIDSHAPAQGIFSSNARARCESNSAVQATHGPSEQASAHHMIVSFPRISIRSTYLLSTRLSRPSSPKLRPAMPLRTLAPRPLQAALSAASVTTMTPGR